MMIRATLFSVIFAASQCAAALVTNSIWYASSVSEDGNGPLDLLALIAYDDTRTNAPIGVVMHGFFGVTVTGLVTNNLRRLVDQGLFAVAPALRGRDGSDGTRDSGGLEVQDIVDAVRAVRAAYPALVDAERTYLSGYSGGGGNAMSCLVRFPDFFTLAASFFGMSDYGYDQTYGWYFNGAAADHIAIMTQDVGVATGATGDVQDAYRARASYLGRANVVTPAHLFYDSNESVCPPSHQTRFANGNTNITLHEGAPGTWPHGYLTDAQQAAAETNILPALVDGSIENPSIPTSGALYVQGWVECIDPPLRCTAGNGVSGSGVLSYVLQSGGGWFRWTAADNASSSAVLTFGGRMWTLASGDQAQHTPDMRSSVVVIVR